MTNSKNRAGLYHTAGVGFAEGDRLQSGGISISVGGQARGDILYLSTCVWILALVCESTGDAIWRDMLRWRRGP